MAFRVTDAEESREATGRCAGSKLRILIVRLSAIGDCILTTPLIAAIRERYPDAHVAWAIEKRAAPLIENHAGLDQLFVVPRHWMKSPRTILAMRRQLRASRFDVVLDPQSLLKSALLGWLSGAPTRIGFGYPAGRELAPVLNNCRVVPTGEHIVDSTLDLLRPLGIEHVEAVFDLPQYCVEQSVLDFPKNCFGKQKRFALVNVGAGWPSKLWPTNRYAEVVRYLGERHQLPSMVVWHREEREMAADLVTNSMGFGVLAPETSLVELAALARMASLFLGSDTGPLHLAAAVHTPTVGLYGPTQPEHCGPYGFEHLAVKPPGDRTQLKMRKSKDNQSMLQIDVPRVCKACDTLLGEDLKTCLQQDQFDAASAR